MHYLTTGFSICPCCGKWDISRKAKCLRPWAQNQAFQQAERAHSSSPSPKLSAGVPGHEPGQPSTPSMSCPAAVRQMPWSWSLGWPRFLGMIHAREWINRPTLPLTPSQTGRDERRMSSRWCHTSELYIFAHIAFSWPYSTLRLWMCINTCAYIFLNPSNALLKHKRLSALTARQKWVQAQTCGWQSF